MDLTCQYLVAPALLPGDMSLPPAVALGRQVPARLQHLRGQVQRPKVLRGARRLTPAVPVRRMPRADEGPSGIYILTS